MQVYVHAKHATNDLPRLYILIEVLKNPPYFSSAQQTLGYAMSILKTTMPYKVCEKVRWS
jgi:hypothetical protein